MREALGLEVAERRLGRGLRRPARERVRRRVQHLEARPHALDVGERREPDRAVAVQLDRPVARGAQEVRRQLAHRVCREQAAGILEVEPVHLGAAGERGGALRVVLVRVHRADRVGEADDDLLDALLPRHPREPPEASGSFDGSAIWKRRIPLRTTQRNESRITSSSAGTHEMKRMPVVMKLSGVPASPR